jgi:hypothetical protein
MTWKPTHLFDGVECRVHKDQTTSGFVEIIWIDTELSYINRIPIILWERHAKPIIEVGTATLPWVSVDDVPHPIDGTEFLAKESYGRISAYWKIGQGPTATLVTHWCRLPEVTP